MLPNSPSTPPPGSNGPAPTSGVPATSPEFTQGLESAYARLRAGLLKNPRTYEWRVQQLTALKRMIEENDKELSAAMWSDLRKSEFECAATEQGIVLSELNITLKKLKSWMKPKPVSTPLYNWPGRSQIVHEPYGLTLIIGAWNYPINLLLAPLVGAIAGGNGAIIKPSEISAHTAALIAKLIPRYLDPDLFAVVEGGAPETSQLLEKKFDLIFFTGSGPVGKIVMAKAAPNLTPVVLELGGKSPAIIWKDAHLETAARRVAWGKFMNAGQTCVAPDYLIIHPAVYDSFIQHLKKSLREFYGDRPSESPDYCRIVNEKNFLRLSRLLKGSKVIYGGQTDQEKLFIEPTLIEALGDAPTMQDELFGPLLPLVKMDSLEKIAAFINERPKPLALYLFTTNDSLSDFMVQATSSGGVCINDNVMHLPVPTLPFGGVGASGMGHYHGRFSFETFTHAKGVLRKTRWLDAFFRYPPYNKKKAWWLKELLR